MCVTCHQARSHSAFTNWMVEFRCSVVIRGTCVIDTHHAVFFSVYHHSHYFVVGFVLHVNRKFFDTSLQVNRKLPILESHFEASPYLYSSIVACTLLPPLMFQSLSYVRILFCSLKTSIEIVSSENLALDPDMT